MQLTTKVQEIIQDYAIGVIPKHELVSRISQEAQIYKGILTYKRAYDYINHILDQERVDMLTKAYTVLGYSLTKGL